MGETTISVSQLKWACLDEGWLERWLKGESPSTYFVATQPIAPVSGELFHGLIEQFCQKLIDSGTEALGQESEDALWQAMFYGFAEPKVDELVEADNLQAAIFLSDALRAFCYRLFSIRATVKDFTRWSDVLFSQEHVVKKFSYVKGDERILISGVIDAVRRHPQNEVEIVDYKLSKSANLRHDLVQLAVYSWLLESTQPGIRFRGCLEYFKPELEPLEVSDQQLREIFRDIVEPVLVRICEAKAALQKPTLPEPPQTSSASGNPLTSTPPAPEPVQLPLIAEADSARTDSSTEPTLPPEHPSLSSPQEPTLLEEKATPPNAEPVAMTTKIRDIFASFDLTVEVEKAEPSPQLERYVLKPGRGVKLVSLVSRADDLQAPLGLSVKPTIETSGEGVFLYIQKSKPDVVFWRDYVNRCKKGGTSVPLGLSLNNSLLEVDFAEPKTCHALVGGTSGSGKSEFLRSIVASLVDRNSAASVRLALIDPQGPTFSGAEELPHLLVPIMRQIKEVIDFLKEAVREMERRYKLFAQERVRDLKTRILDGKRDIPYWLIIFDEFMDLVLGGGEEKKQFEILVARLAARGRAAGIHLVLATQRPDSKVVTGNIKANLPMRVCLRVPDAMNSRIVLDQPGGEKLFGRGDMLVSAGHPQPQRVQGVYISPEEWSSLMREKVGKVLEAQ